METRGGRHHEQEAPPAAPFQQLVIHGATRPGSQRARAVLMAAARALCDACARHERSSVASGWGCGACAMGSWRRQAAKKAAVVLRHLRAAFLEPSWQATHQAGPHARARRRGRRAASLRRRRCSRSWAPARARPRPSVQPAPGALMRSPGHGGFRGGGPIDRRFGRVAFSRRHFARRLSETEAQRSAERRRKSSAAGEYRVDRNAHLNATAASPPRARDGRGGGTSLQHAHSEQPHASRCGRRATAGEDAAARIVTSPRAWPRARGCRRRRPAAAWRAAPLRRWPPTTLYRRARPRRADAAPPRDSRRRRERELAPAARDEATHGQIRSRLDA